MTDHTGLLTRLLTGQPTTLHQISYSDLSQSIAILGRAVLDASDPESASLGECHYCRAEGTKPHRAGCPVPVARAMLRFTDDWTAEPDGSGEESGT